MALCLKEINIPKMFLEDSLRKMAKQLQSAPDKDAPAVKQLSYYAQIPLHYTNCHQNPGELRHNNVLPLRIGTTVYMVL